MASNDVELSEEPQLDSAASHNPVLCQPDMTSGHVRDDPRACVETAFDLLIHGWQSSQPGSGDAATDTEPRRG